ncbi:MAG: hypothetical protein AAGA80_15785 [Cyanobacteria bacterium P01_F01_bin.143]
MNQENPTQTPNKELSEQPLSISDSGNTNLDQEHRFQQDALDARHRRWRMNSVIALSAIGIIFVFFLCWQTLNDPRSSPNDKRWATAFVTSVVAGSVGFLTGKAVS